MTTAQIVGSVVIGLVSLAFAAYHVREMEKLRGVDFWFALVFAVGHVGLALICGVAVALEVVKWTN